MQPYIPSVQPASDVKNVRTLHSLVLKSNLYEMVKATLGLCCRSYHFSNMSNIQHSISARSKLKLIPCISQRL